MLNAVRPVLFLINLENIGNISNLFYWCTLFVLLRPQAFKIKEADSKVRNLITLNISQIYWTQFFNYLQNGFSANCLKNLLLRQPQQVCCIYIPYTQPLERVFPPIDVCSHKYIDMTPGDQGHWLRRGV